MTDYTLTVDTQAVAITANNVGVAKGYQSNISTASISVGTNPVELQQFMTAYFNHQIELTAYFDA